jgi:hypothetical protein
LTAISGIPEMTSAAWPAAARIHLVPHLIEMMKQLCPGAFLFFPLRLGQPLQSRHVGGTERVRELVSPRA